MPAIATKKTEPKVRPTKVTKLDAITLEPTLGPNGVVYQTPKQKAASDALDARIAARKAASLHSMPQAEPMPKAPWEAELEKPEITHFSTEPGSVNLAPGAKVRKARAPKAPKPTNPKIDTTPSQSPKALMTAIRKEGFEAGAAKVQKQVEKLEAKLAKLEAIITKLREPKPVVEPKADKRDKQIEKLQKHTEQQAAEISQLRSAEKTLLETNKGLLRDLKELRKIDPKAISEKAFAAGRDLAAKLFAGYAKNLKNLTEKEQ